MEAGRTALLEERLRARLPQDASGRITYGARANAVKGRVPTRDRPSESVQFHGRDGNFRVC